MTEQERFRRCLAQILKHEGGYVDHPSDPGGATNLGVTLATAQQHGLDCDGDGDVDKRDVRLLTPERVEPVYRKGYWEAVGCDKLPAGVDLMVFDMAVNSGVSRAAKFLQACVGATPDGKVGPATLRAASAVKPDVLIARYAERREAFYRSLGTFKVFGRGWMRRLVDVSRQAAAWA